MTRAEILFFTLFTLLCVVFAPVYFFYGMTDITVPLSAILYDGGRRYLAEGRSGILLFGWIAMTLYTLCFMIIGSSLVRITRKMTNRQIRNTVRCTLLLVVALYSFLPLITYNSPAGSGGSYNFWTGVIRYFERW